MCTREFNAEPTKQFIVDLPQESTQQKFGFKYLQWQGMSIVETRWARHTKQLEMPLTVLPNVMNEQLLFVGSDFKQCKSCND